MAALPVCRMVFHLGGRVRLANILMIAHDSAKNAKPRIVGTLWAQSLPSNRNMAAATSAIIPVIILFIFCQKYFVQGVNVGAVKE